jgi:hypothetical protein
MRTITNRANLPTPMYNALAHDGYVGGGDTSSTKLIGPPRIATLRKFHEDEIVEDASDRIWSLMGKAVHYILATSGGVKPEEYIRETRLMMPVQGIEKDGDFWTWKVSGQPDVFHKPGRRLSDYKVTSIWSVLFGSKPEWEKQLNIQALLHRHNGDTVDTAEIIVIMRDWVVGKARREKNYPQTATMSIPLPVWPKEDQLDYVRRRVRIHQKAQQDYEVAKDANVLPLCTDEERWYRGHKYKVKKKSLKDGRVNIKSDRVFDNKTDALQFMSDNAGNLPKGKIWAPLEEQPGQNLRCLFYCDVAKFCPFGQKVQADAQGLVTENGDDDE